ncbi:N-acetyl-D-Glu racemase DgcA [Propylenella binzhouense]|uniref:Dipeptide epimerase n=1 Tax=Propylenella binzhouense TaxID=2555902 RepID=A0A964T3L8_9HYPH|nr:N-acetyl-D-Glu racemase DgcA [Propylenella binzhouense]MYZ47760.1 dipeptide epimerase [Propylenella binzhouense]
MTLRVTACIEKWPIAGRFVISRGARTEATVVAVELSDGSAAGRAECVPYARYGETPESVLAQIEAVAGTLSDRTALQALLPPGAARNALDCALWDLEAKRSGVPVAHRCAGMMPRPVLTAYTLSLGTPDEMSEATRKAAGRPLLKVKLGGDGDVERIRAVRAAAPRARLVVDANEAWSEENYLENMIACLESGVFLIEQPLPAGADDLLLHVPHPVPICADESLHVFEDLEKIAGKYDAVNVKLDKAGGLTEALRTVEEARRRGFLVMVGCMLGTSLAMAPAVLLAQYAQVADLDGPLLLARDRRPGLRYAGAMVEPPLPALWG